MITRINVSFPEETYRLIKRVAPKRGISRFLAEAAEEKIRNLERVKAFREILSAPPAFTDIKNSVAWVRRMRRFDEKRLKRLGV